MKKNRWMLCLAVLLAAMAGGCVSRRQTVPSDGEAIAYTVMDLEQLPQQLAELIETNRQKEILMSYKSGEDLYLIRGYGERQGSGYRIAVTRCCRSDSGILLETQLLGPEETEQASDAVSCPVLVLRIDSSEEEAYGNVDESVSAPIN